MASTTTLNSAVAALEVQIQRASSTQGSAGVGQAIGEVKRFIDEIRALGVTIAPSPQDGGTATDVGDALGAVSSALTEQAYSSGQQQQMVQGSFVRMRDRVASLGISTTP